MTDKPKQKPSNVSRQKEGSFITEFKEAVDPNRNINITDGPGDPGTRKIMMNVPTPEERESKPKDDK